MIKYSKSIHVSLVLKLETLWFKCKSEQIKIKCELNYNYRNELNCLLTQQTRENNLQPIISKHHKGRASNFTKTFLCFGRILMAVGTG